MKTTKIFAFAVVAFAVILCLPGCEPVALGGEFAPAPAPQPQYQLQTVQDAPTVQYQTRSRQVMTQQTVSEQVPVQRTVTRMERRTKTVMVPKQVVERVPVQHTVTEMQTRQRTVSAPRTVTDRVAVRVQSPPRQVCVAVQPQSVAIGMSSNRHGSAASQRWNRLPGRLTFRNLR